MDTQNIIQASANIVRITSLKKGDVYKRVEETSYDTKMIYGIVMDILNHGDNSCYIEALEYTKNYSMVTATVKVLSGKQDIALFPTTPTEVYDYLHGAVAYMAKELEKTEKEVAEKKEALAKATEFVSGETAKKLTAPTWVETSVHEKLLS